MTQPSPSRVKLHGPGAVAAAVPHLLGYHPTESLVLLRLDGPRCAVSFALRVDLTDPFPPGDLALRMQRSGATATLLLVYGEQPDDDGGLPHRGLVAEMVEQLRGHGCPPLDAVLVRGGRWWSYHCADPTCCPPEGASLPPGPSPVALAAAVEHGRATLPDRAALARSIAPVGGVTRVSMEQATDRALGWLAEELRAGRAAQAQAELLAAYDDALRRLADPSTELTHDEAARLLVGAHDIDIRDELLVRCMRADGGVLFTLLERLCRLAGPGADAPVCTLLAAAAYARGDGTLAAIALDRALTSDPGYRMAVLLEQALVGQVEPRVLREALGVTPGRSSDAPAATRRPPRPRRSRRRPPRAR